MEFVGEGPAPDGVAALAGARWVSALDHEALHVAVEGRVVVVAGGAEGEEVEGGSLGGVAVHFDLDVAQACVECYRHFILGRGEMSLFNNRAMYLELCVGYWLLACSFGCLLLFLRVILK